MEYIIGVILLMLLFALPDALRHKRRYPHRGNAAAALWIRRNQGSVRSRDQLLREHRSRDRPKDGYQKNRVRPDRPRGPLGRRIQEGPGRFPARQLLQSGRCRNWHPFPLLLPSYIRISSLRPGAGSPARHAISMQDSSGPNYCRNLFPCGIGNNDTATGRLLAAVFPLR